MAKQTFTALQVLTAAQVSALQANDYNQTVSAKTASYVLVAADVGTRITMNAAGATTITVDTALFAAGDTLFITNIGAGASTITAGTATVSTASTLVLAQYESGRLYFTSAGVSIWEKYQAAAGGGGIVQVKYGTLATFPSSTSATYADTGLTVSITPTKTTNKIKVTISFPAWRYDLGSAGTSSYDYCNIFQGVQLTEVVLGQNNFASSVLVIYGQTVFTYIDSPASIAALTYKCQYKVGTSTTVYPNGTSGTSVATIVVEEFTP